jgi:enolase
MNVVNGGAHSTNNVDFQEFMLFPVGAPSFAEALRYGAETFHALKKILQKRGLVTAVGDEGGFAPNLKTNDEAVEVIVEAIRAAGYQPARTSPSRSTPLHEFLRQASTSSRSPTAPGKTPARLSPSTADGTKKYPILSLEDGMGERTATAGSPSQGLATSSSSSATTTSSPTTQDLRRGHPRRHRQRDPIKHNQNGTVLERSRPSRCAQKNVTRRDLPPHGRDR